MPKDWENFEEIARRVQEQLSPMARVTRNEKIKGKSGIQNQCDIVIRSRIGTIDFLGVIECKDYNDKVGVEIIRGFKSKLDDIGAMKGIIVSANGFTSDAYKYAGETRIDTFLLVDADSIKWNNIPVVPICLVKIFLEYCSIKNFNVETGDQICLQYDDGRDVEDHNYHYWDNIEKRYITLRGLIEKVWDDHAKPDSLPHNRLTYSTEVGRFSLYQGEKPLVPVIIQLELEAKIEYHYGRLSLSEGQGFFDSQNDVLHSKEFRCSAILWNEALKNWPSTFDSSTIPFKPIFYIYIVHFFSKRDKPAPAMLEVGGGIK